MAQYTMIEVAERFEEAVDTLNRLPAVKVPEYFNTWPDLLPAGIEPARDEKAKLRLGPASPDAISRMEKTIQWIFLIEDDQERRLVWMRAERVRWKLICRWLGCGRTTAHYRWRIALYKIAAALNAHSPPS